MKNVFMSKFNLPCLFNPILQSTFASMMCLVLLAGTPAFAQAPATGSNSIARQRISINDGWRFYKYNSGAEADKLIYDVRTKVKDTDKSVIADEMPTEAVKVEAKQNVLKPWILPTGNDFIKDPAKRYVRPEGNPGSDFPFVQSDFDDSSWQSVNLPHDWAIKGPFQKGSSPGVGGSMGRLPSPGVTWYRKKLDISDADAGKSIFLDVDGAMSYAMVWLNGKLVGGWPYGYASWRVNLTPYIVPGSENQLAIRLDNPPDSSRWYPGGGIYRNVWLTKTNSIHVGHWGTFITTADVSKTFANINLEVTIDNDSKEAAVVETSTDVFSLDDEGNKTGDIVISFKPLKTTIGAGESAEVKGSVTMKNPRLWGPPPTQRPNRYAAVTTVSQNGKEIDCYETRFGIRTVQFDPNQGILVNGEHISIRGANQHHDLGALGAAFNTRAAERQLEILREMGCNAVRTSHNPPAPELLELTDRMGFLIMDEIFDVWERKKTPLDFHLIFPDWYEQDTRAFVRRDRNHPSVIIWSFGNEVGEQYTGEQGAAVAKRLYDIVKQEDATRPTTTAMNWSRPSMPLPRVPDIIGLNYQGEGIRNAPAYSGIRGISTPPQYPAFHEKFPDKVVVSCENAAALSSRGTYLFPVCDGISAPVRDGSGGDPKNQYVSAYELYTADFGSSADKVFASLDKHPYVAGGFVWSGWDYLGEPTPYYGARSSYFGVIDLAGFKKDRFYLYQSHWRPELPMAHILPHWTWPNRVGQVTPVHVFTSGDEAELFLNGKSLGRKKKQQYEYRLRWDDVKYEPGELKVVAYKDGKEWAADVMRTAGKASKIVFQPDRTTINADGLDLSFVTATVQDSKGITVPEADNLIRFSVSGPGEIVATDNGDPTDFDSFSSGNRKAFSGLALVVVRSKPGQPGTIELKAESDSLQSATVTLQSTGEKVKTVVAQHIDREKVSKLKSGENPIIRDIFTADPAPLIYRDTVYLYVGHDEAKGNEMFNMKEWLCYSSTDMKNWTPHGPIMKPTDFKWAVRDAWAAQTVEKNGKFYFYATVQHDDTHPGKAIGVAVSDDPTGPFVDARGSALVTDSTTPGPNGWDDIDPTVFIDDDGTAWLAWGNPNCYLAKLKPNMLEIDGPIQKIDLPNYTEGPWLYKRGDMYYLVYAAFAHQGQWEKICYATAPNITGPWTYRGIITGSAKNSYTIHPGIIEFGGQWYFFYHNAVLTLPNGETGALGRRSVCMEYLYYNPDGTIKPIKQTKQGVGVPP
jgi:beta-galactosidase